MKSTELRIGNWVLHKDVIQFVESINDTDSGMAVCCLSEHDNGCVNIKPIPLTEEWLLKLGLKHEKFTDEINDLWHWTKQDFFIDLSGVIGFDHYELRELGDSLNAICLTENDFKYVHCLQNLYFALTGKELTIKEQK